MVNLHTHSMFSLRDSIIRPEDFVERLQEIGQNAVAITDHGGSLGGVTLYQTLKASGIRYIHGCEFYICDDTSVRDKDNKYGKAILPQHMKCLKEFFRESRSMPTRSFHQNKDIQNAK